MFKLNLIWPPCVFSGWYHAKDTPAQMEDATLSRLKSTAKGEDTEGAFTPLKENKSISVASEDNTFSEKDRNFLSKYINNIYLGEENIISICKQFEEASSVQLRKFLKENWVQKLSIATAREDKACNLGKGQAPADYTVGVGGSWKAVGPAHKQRFLEYVGDDILVEGMAETELSAGRLLIHLQRKVLQSAAFGRYLKHMTNLGMPLGYRGRARRFRPGLDYTVAHYGILTTKPVLDATLCFVAGNGNQCTFDEATGELIGSDEDATWESGDCGGFECYIAADDEEEDRQEAADEYNDDDDTDLLSVSASNNVLSLVFRDEGTMRFVKYLGSAAPSSRWDLSMEYEVEEIEDDDEETEDEEEQEEGGNDGDGIE